jgi:pyrimidine deaminase RibD-like protein
MDLKTFVKTTLLEFSFLLLLAGCSKYGNTEACTSEISRLQIELSKIASNEQGGESGVKLYPAHAEYPPIVIDALGNVYAVRFDSKVDRYWLDTIK